MCIQKLRQKFCKKKGLQFYGMEEVSIIVNTIRAIIYCSDVTISILLNNTKY